MEGVPTKVIFFLCWALTRVIARTSAHMKMSRDIEPPIAAILATAKMLREALSSEMEVLSCVKSVVVVDTVVVGGEEHAGEVLESDEQGEEPAGYYMKHCH